MVEGANTNPTKKIDSTKILGVVFCMLCALVFGLTVAIIVVRVVGKGGENPGGESTSFSCSDYSEVTDIVSCVRSEYEYNKETASQGIGACIGICAKYAEAAVARLEKDQPVNKYEYIKSFFAAFSAATNDEQSQAGLVFVRNREILKLKDGSQYIEELLADAIKADEILKTPSSASEVISLAYSADEPELGQKYVKIKEAREIERGINPSTGQGEG